MAGIRAIQKEKTRRLPVDHLGQLRLSRDHNRRTAPDQLYRNDEGGPGRGRLSGEVIWKKQRSKA